METRPSSASLATRIAAMRPEGPTGFHVAFDTMQARRGRSDPERIGVNGYLLLDIGQYRLGHRRDPPADLLADEGDGTPSPSPER
jgi:hypothetical protein